MAHRYWPLFDLRVRTPRLELRPPSDEDAVALAALAAEGVHDPAATPFTIPWTDQPSPQLERGALQFIWRCRAEWTPEKWHLPLAVLHLAFAGLGAERAISGAWHDNGPSIGVSRALGYVDNGEDVKLRRDQPDRQVRFLLTRDGWEETARAASYPDIVIEQLEPCRDLFGLR
jgi:RimJ/RimL family protein N-acetyltransferase